jgi:murein L,D-transpeptidase YafK
MRKQVLLFGFLLVAGFTAMTQASVKKTVADRLLEHGPAARARLAPAFARAELAYPPDRITLIGLKEEGVLELWAARADGPWKRVQTYPILRQSGGPGPKLREGDRQVPEGFYRIESLNPNSRYHLSLRLDYPSAEDLRQAKADGRDQPGSDIMIHGKAVSIGCLAMGDPAIEEIFVLAADSGIGKIAVLLCPLDFRRSDLPAGPSPRPDWVGERYRRLREALAAFDAAP